ncbi:LrgB family protein [Mycetocola zhadangensis]|uniref:LrgB family protein n=1 Tax=Mycetocola zhadangensis TaxID=1164595 RepID=UPI003A4E0EF1
MWDQLLDSPVFGIGVTIIGFALATVFARAVKNAAWANPILWASAGIVSLLLVTRVDYAQYMAGGQYFVPLLGLAVVSLAAPPFRHRKALRSSSAAVLFAVGIGSAAGVGMTIFLAWIFGGSRDTILSVAPKQATSPVAFDVANLAGGSGELAAVLAILTGMLGATLGPAALNLFRFTDARERGLAIGVSAHAIGTARIVTREPVAGAFAVVGMVVAAVYVTVLVPAALWVISFL